MMIKITQKCSMGCSHCMNDAKPCGNHMDFATFVSAINFQKKYGGPICFITGGEPMEHPNFFQFLGYAIEKLPNTAFCIATNGFYLQDEYVAKEVYKLHDKHVLFQITTDSRYYPIQIDLTLPVFNAPNVEVITSIPKIYPQGRAFDNNLEWEAKGSKCCNVRGIARQIQKKTFTNLINAMLITNRICTPHIDINGNIKLGESDLCPACSNIYKEENEIMNDILNFNCHKCDFINKNLPQGMKDLLGVDI